MQQVLDDTFQDRLAGVLLGTAVGDAVGLPTEGLSPRRRQRLLPGPWRHRFLCRRGMISDDTEHTLMVAQSLLMREGKAPAVGERIPRVAKLMALAIRFDGLIRDGVVKDQAELAKLGHVTRARLTQIMAFLNLAPDIQEAILTLRAPEAGRDAVTEKQLRPVAIEPEWRKQRKMWARMGPK